MIIEKGILKSRIITDNPELLNKLRSLYSFKVDGAQYSMRYRPGWDGMVKFIDKFGKFRTGLLPLILKSLERIDCFPEVETDLPEESIETVEVDKFTYRDYQKELIDKALELKRGIIKSPTGSGKTLIMAGLVKSLGDRTMTILFRSKSLLVQTYEFLKSCGIQDLGINFGEGFIQNRIMLSTPHSLPKILDHVEDSDVLIVDEVHEFSKGRDSLAIINSFPKASIRIGLTATVPRKKIPRYNIIGAFGEVIEEVKTKDLVESGVLAKPTIMMIDLPQPSMEDDVFCDDSSYIDIYDRFISNSQIRNESIVRVVDAIREKNEKARVLVIVKSLKHGALLDELLGEESSYIEGINSVEERYTAINNFRGADGNSILIGTTILQTGIDIKEITHYINARGESSEIATIQALGRSLRSSEGKSSVYVYDFVDHVKHLGKHSKERIRHYKREGHEVQYIKFKDK